MRRNRIPAFVSAAALTAILCAGVTTAYFSDSDSLRNTVAAGRNESQIEEEFPDPPDPGGEEDPEYKKTVWVKNVAPSETYFNVDCYVRVSVSYSNYDIGRAVTLLGLDTANWRYNSSDGYYYYLHLLKEGQSTTPLFTGFSIQREQIETRYLDTIGDFEIQVYEESVAAGEFKDYQSAWNFYLNPVRGV